jgi:hypothetical protein
MLSPTQTAWSLPEASAVTAISIRSFGWVPLVTTARLDNVRPKVVFRCDMAASIGRGDALVSRRRFAPFGSSVRSKPWLLPSRQYHCNHQIRSGETWTPKVLRPPARVWNVGCHDSNILETTSVAICISKTGVSCYARIKQTVSANFLRPSPPVLARARAENQNQR